VSYLVSRQTIEALDFNST